MRLIPALKTAALALALGVFAAAPARAHPHVWVIVSGEILRGTDGAMIGLRFAWEFDDMFSAFATQGLDINGDGKLSRQELADLAKTNVESLKEYDYFTYGNAGRRKLAFEPPTDYYLEQQGEVLVLHFTLPLARPQALAGTLKLDVYDPTMFIAFTFAEGDAPLTVAGDAGCALAYQRPPPIQPGQALTQPESFFNNLNASSGFGARFANRATVTCK